jgi:hypothetical protein
MASNAGERILKNLSKWEQNNEFDWWSDQYCSHLIEIIFQFRFQGLKKLCCWGLVGTLFIINIHSKTRKNENIGAIIVVRLK